MLGHQTSLVFLVPLRICCGWVLLTAGFGKIESGWLTSPALSSRIQGWLDAGQAYHFYLPVLHRLLPHARVASPVVALTELAVGAALLLGLFSRWSAFFGLLLMANYFLAAGHGLGANPSAPLCAALLTLTLAGSGRALGLDAALLDRAPRWLC